MSVIGASYLLAGPHMLPGPGDFPPFIEAPTRVSAWVPQKTKSLSGDTPATKA
jgi:hypothetical protein